MKDIITTKIKNNWIQFIIIIQPILDILSYFQLKYMETSYTWIIRVMILMAVVIISFISSKNKKKLILYLLPYVIFLSMHILNLYRINQLSIIQDGKYFILTYQLPILSICLIDYIKSTNFELNKIKKSICYNFAIIATSVLISYITNTYLSTYASSGITGWFSSANTQSMIICAIAPWVLYMASEFKNIFYYTISCLSVFLLLYFNATRACYLTLLASYVVMLFVIIVSKKEYKRISKAIICFLFIGIVVFSYKYSFTSDKESITSDVTSKNENVVEQIIAEKEKDNEVELEINWENLDTSNNELILEILKTSYIYEDLINIHGEEKVVEIMKPYLTPYALSDNRLVKQINAKIEYNDSDVLTHVLGLGYGKIYKNSLDMENDLQAIFYYYGYLGTAVYGAFILYFIVRAVIEFFKNKKLIQNKEYIIILFLIVLLLFGGEYSGAFLRKPNANIYLSLYLVLFYFVFSQKNMLEEKNKTEKKKITFLLLHLGYGGVEVATSNLANILSNDYEIELITFYNLYGKPVYKLNENIVVKFLFNGRPNKKELLESVKSFKVIKAINEAFKSFKILFLKKYLVIKAIKECDADIIISTRVEFTELLNKYYSGIAKTISQEHVYHNNDDKYIKRIIKSLKNIDYFMPVSKSMTKFYKEIIKGKTKVIYSPLAVDYIPEGKSKKNKKNIISIGRLSPEKGYLDLIDVFKLINDKDKECKLFIIGDGNEKTKIEKKIKELNLGKYIVLYGYKDKEFIREELKNMSIYLMGSFEESLGLVLLEASAFEIPCLAFDSAEGAKEIIKNNEDGYLISNRNKEEMAQKTVDLLNNKNKLELFGKSARVKAQKYSFENVKNEWIQILKNI